MTAAQRGLGVPMPGPEHVESRTRLTTSRGWSGNTNLANPPAAASFAFVLKGLFAVPSDELVFWAGRWRPFFDFLEWRMQWSEREPACVERFAIT